MDTPTLTARDDLELAVGQVGAALGEDLDDAVGRVGTVERGRRGALDDLDPLDVFTGDVGQGRGTVARVEPAANDDAVDDDERILPAADAGGAAQLDVRGRTRLTGGTGDPDAGHLALQRLQGRGARHLLQLLLVHLADREGQLLGGRGFRNAGHDQLVEAERVGIEREVLFLRAQVDLDLPRRRLVSEEAGRQRDGLSPGSRCGDRDRVGAVGGGRRTKIGVGDDDRGPAERVAPFGHHPAADDRRILRRQRRRRDRQPDQGGAAQEKRAQP